MTLDRLDRRIFCLIPARSGSSRVADKNIQEVGGRTLLARAVGIALEAFGRVFVSTDSALYGEQARAAGATVPSLRPANLSTTEAGIDDAVHHALREWATDEEIFVLVQATSPFTTADDLLSVVADVDAASDGGCALTVVSVSASHGSLMVEEGSTARFLDPQIAALRTQDVPPLAMPTGGAYAASVERLLRGQPLMAPPFSLTWVPNERALDIDNEADLARARVLAGDR